MALLHLVSAKADHTDRPKPRNVALWRRESVLPGTPHSLLSHVLAALRSLRAPPFLDPSSGTSGPSAASFCFLFFLTGTQMHAPPKKLTLPRDSRFPRDKALGF